MYHQFKVIIILIFLAESNFLLAQEGYLLNDLTFSGNVTFSDDVLIGQTSLYTLNWFEKSILRKDKFVFSEEYLDADIAEMIFYYQQNGFLHVKISYQFLDLDHDERTLELGILVEEDSAVTVNEVNYSVHIAESLFKGKVDSLIDVLSPDMILKKGMQFKDQHLEKDKNRIINTFLNSGYAYIDVEHELDLADSEKNVDIIWKVDPGPLCYFGQIQILTEKDDNELLILDRVEFTTGDLYEKILLDTTQRSIYALTLFQVVSVTAFLDDQKSNIIPVNISVKEAPTITTRFGIGYGSEAKFRVFADIQKSAFLGGTRRLNLLLSYSAIEPYNVDLRFIQPFFLTRSLTLVLNPFMRKQDEPGFKVARKGFKTSFLYSFIRRLTSSLAYTYEDVKRDTVDFDSDLEVFDERYRGLYDKSMINLGLTWDTSTPMFTPYRGFLTSINFQFNGLVGDVEYPFQKTILDLRTYQKVFASVVAIRLKLGGITAVSDNEFIPVEERFYAGGSYSIRGWPRQELGPKDITGNPAGGKSLLEFSTELRYPIYDMVSGVGFVDCGNVWIESYKWYLNEIRYSLGAGLRIKTPIGPIRLDVARPVLDEDTTWQVHFSVGNAF